MPLSEIPHSEKQALRKLVLEFFSEPKMSRNMNQEPEFANSGYTNLEIRKMMYGLETAGLLYKPRGSGPGSVYALTTDGLAMLEVSEQLQQLYDQNL